MIKDESMNVKELVESVKVHECTLSFSLPKIQVVEKSDFDRVVKILVDSMNMYKVDAIKYAEELGRE